MKKKLIAIWFLSHLEKPPTNVTIRWKNTRKLNFKLGKFRVVPLWKSISLRSAFASGILKRPLENWNIFTRKNRHSHHLEMEMISYFSSKEIGFLLIALHSWWLWSSFLFTSSNFLRLFFPAQCSSSKGCCAFLSCEGNVCRDKAVVVEGTETLGYKPNNNTVDNRFGEGENTLIPAQVTAAPANIKCAEIGSKVWRRLLVFIDFCAQTSSDVNFISFIIVLQGVGML